MTTLKAFTRQHPVLAYYVLTFAISWGGLLLAIGGPGGIPGTPEEVKRLLPFVILALLVGPSAAGILLTSYIYGKAGLHELLSRLLKWQVSALWYAIALLIAPFAMTAIPLALSLLFPGFLPNIIATDDKASLLLMGVAAGLAAGIFEEVGWTGFVIPRLRLQYDILTTGIIVGALWGVWHLLVNFWSSGTPAGTLSLTLLLHSVLFSVGILPAYRMLMVWVYDRTGSLLVALLMHMSLTTGNILFVPLATEKYGMSWTLIVAATLWVVVAGVTLARRGYRAAPAH